MKFDYCLGNPPYQEQKGGTKNIDIWPQFLFKTTDICDKVCLIHPGRWVVPTKNFQKRHDEIIHNGLKSFNYITNSNDVFSGVSIDGGISITMFEKNYNGDIKYFINGENKGIYIDEEKFFSNNFEEEVYNKVFLKITNSMKDRVKGGIGTLGYSDKYAYLDEESLAHIKDISDGMNEPIKVWATKTTGKGGAKYDWYYIDKCYIKNIADYQFKSRKVMLDKKGHAIVYGKGNVFNNLPQICDKYSYGVNVLWVIPENDNDRDLELIKSLFMTKTARYLMCITQKSLFTRGFENVPDYLELAKLLPEDQLFSDEWFYKTFDFSKELINEIETRVSEKVEK